MFKVYLAGPIASQDLKTTTKWRTQMTQALAQYGITGYSPLRYKTQFLPQSGPVGHDTSHYVDHPLVRQQGITARDRNDVVTSDLMLVNFLGYTGKPTGTAVEFGWADAFRIPIVMMADDDATLHPMIESIAAFRTSSMGEAVEIIKAVLLP